MGVSVRALGPIRVEKDLEEIFLLPTERKLADRYPIEEAEEMRGRKKNRREGGGRRERRGDNMREGREEKGRMKRGRG